MIDVRPAGVSIKMSPTWEAPSADSSLCVHKRHPEMRVSQLDEESLHSRPDLDQDAHQLMRNLFARRPFG